MSKAIPRLNYIKTKLDAIDTAQSHLKQRLQYMRDSGTFKEGGYSTFEEYCDSELEQFGGYARVKQILDRES